MIRRSERLLLDVGGTFIKCSDGRCIPVPSAGTRDAIAAALRQAIGSQSKIAVAIPGPFDYEKGIFLMRHKFAAVYGESFRVLADLPEDADVIFCHDVIAALLGCEGDNEALVTIGTGLGFAHKEKGRVQVGPTGSPARAIYNLPWGDGILEDAVSARGLRNAYARLTGRTDLSAAQIAGLADTGDEPAQEVYSTLGETLGTALAPLLEELRVGTLLLAGQISRSLHLFERPLRNALDGIDIRHAPAGAVFAGLCRLFDANDR